MKALLIQELPEDQKKVINNVPLDEMKMQFIRRIMEARDSFAITTAGFTITNIMYTRIMSDNPEFDSDQIIEVERPIGSRIYKEFAKEVIGVG